MDTWLIYSGNTQGPNRLTVATAPRATHRYIYIYILTYLLTNLLFFFFFFFLIYLSSNVCSWQIYIIQLPIDQVGSIRTSSLHEFQAKVVYCRWQYTLLQILTMTQPPRSHHPLHGSHLIHTYIHTYKHTNIHQYIHTYICTYIHTYKHTCIDTYIHKYINTYIHIRACMHQYIHTYIHTHGWTAWFLVTIGLLGNKLGISRWLNG